MGGRWCLTGLGSTGQGSLRQGSSPGHGSPEHGEFLGQDVFQDRGVSRTGLSRTWEFFRTGGSLEQGGSPGHNSLGQVFSRIQGSSGQRCCLGQGVLYNTEFSRIEGGIWDSCVL